MRNTHTHTTRTDQFTKKPTMAHPRFQLGPGLLSAGNVLNNLQLVNESIDDCQEELRRMQCRFDAAQDLAKELGYPADIDESVQRLEDLRAGQHGLEDKCTEIREGLQARIEKMKELSVATPDEMSSFFQTLGPEVGVFLVRLIPRVFNDRHSMLDISPQYKELILEDLMYLDKRQGPTLTQEQVNSEKMQHLKAEIAILKKDKQSLRREVKEKGDRIVSLERRNESDAVKSERRKQQRDINDQEVRRLVKEKQGINEAKKEAEKKLIDEKRHYKNLKATSEDLQGEKDRLAGELRASVEASRKKDAEIETLNNRVSKLFGANSGTSKSVKELKATCRNLQAQNEKIRDDLRDQEQKMISDKETARARYKQKVDELENRAGDLAHKLEDANECAQELREKNEALRKTVEKYQNQRAEASSELRKLRRRYSSKKDMVQALEEEKEAIQGDKEMAEGKVDTLQGSLDRMRARIDEMTKREQQLTLNEEQLTRRLDEGKVSAGVTVTGLKSRIVELEDKVMSLEFQLEGTKQPLAAAFEREEKLQSSLDRLNKAHRGCNETATSLREKLADANDELADAILAKDKLAETTEKLNGNVSKLKESSAREGRAAAKIRDENQVLQREKEEALGRLQQEQEEVLRLGEARDSLHSEVTQQVRQITDLTEKFANAEIEQQRLHESLENEKGAHAGTTAREEELKIQLSDCKQQARQVGEDLQHQLSKAESSLEAAREDIETQRASYDNLQKTLDGHKTDAKERQDALQGELSALRATLSTETASKQDATRKMNSNAEGIQQFVVRACQIPTAKSRVANGLALEIQRSTYVVATAESHTRWEILDSWTDDIAQEGNEAVQLPSTLELLVLELFGAVHDGRINTKMCQTAMHKMSDVLLSIPKIHAGVMIQLGTAVVQEITSRADVSLEIGAAFWQIMSIVEERWESPYQAEWMEMKHKLETKLGGHEYKEAFAVLSGKTELQEGELCHLYGSTYAVFCRPSWADAVLFNIETRSMRFFSKKRWTLNCMNATIEPVGLGDKITLPWDSDRDMEWALGWM